MWGIKRKKEKSGMDYGSLLWSCVVWLFCSNSPTGHILPHCSVAFPLLGFMHSWQIRQGLWKRKEICLLSGLLLVHLLAICTLLELLSMWNLTRIEVLLCNVLSPEAPPLSIANYNWCLVSISPSLLLYDDGFEWCYHVCLIHFNCSMEAFW